MSSVLAAPRRILSSACLPCRIWPKPLVLADLGGSGDLRPANLHPISLQNVTIVTFWREIRTGSAGPQCTRPTTNCTFAIWKPLNASSLGKTLQLETFWVTSAQRVPTPAGFNRSAGFTAIQPIRTIVDSARIYRTPSHRRWAQSRDPDEPAQRAG